MPFTPSLQTQNALGSGLLFAIYAISPDSLFLLLAALLCLFLNRRELTVARAPRLSGHLTGRGSPLHAALLAGGPGGDPVVGPGRGKCVSRLLRRRRIMTDIMRCGSVRRHKGVMPRRRRDSPRVGLTRPHPFVSASPLKLPSGEKSPLSLRALDAALRRQSPLAARGEFASSSNATIPHFPAAPRQPSVNTPPAESAELRAPSRRSLRPPSTGICPPDASHWRFRHLPPAQARRPTMAECDDGRGDSASGGSAFWAPHNKSGVPKTRSNGKAGKEKLWGL